MNLAMTDNIKVISRPKVRFHQFSDDSRNEEIVEHYKEQVVAQASGSSIEEFVSSKKPVGIVDPKESTNVHDKDISLDNSNIDTSSHYGITSGDIRSMSSSNKDVTRAESKMILCDTNGIQNTEDCKMPQLDKSLQDNSLKDRAKCLRQKGKENKDVPSRRIVSSRNVNEPRMGNSLRVKSIREKFKLATGDNCRERVNVRAKMTKSQSAPSIMKKNSTIQGVLNAKPVTAPSRVTSCYKTAKNKISPVKKIVLRNVSGPKIKTSVRPGVFRKKQNDAKSNDANGKHSVMSNVTVDLAQPEYNSIMCTINKLKEFEQQKIVTDINHLPSTLKKFLNGKVNFYKSLYIYFLLTSLLQISAALDFPLDEVIYKNLVDLSIDERQLPSTITRSKDPEPRQKDIVPKLSNFFIPEYTKEVCEAMHIKSRASKIDDNWNAFKISDRILEWKYSIDDIG